MRVQENLAGRPGKVESAGAFTSEETIRELRAALPDSIASHVTPRLEWYGCRGAFFHNDAHFGRVLFGIWSLHGPDRDVVFPRIGHRFSTSGGTLIVFDPFEPHAVLDRGASTYRREDYERALPNLFLGFELELNPETHRLFGTGPAREGLPVLSSRIAINPETGALATAGV
jgi:hypothetical protein